LAYRAFDRHGTAEISDGRYMSYSYDALALFRQMRQKKRRVGLLEKYSY
jgi:hypothetical protein